MLISHFMPRFKQNHVLFLGYQNYSNASFFCIYLLMRRWINKSITLNRESRHSVTTGPPPLTLSLLYFIQMHISSIPNSIHKFSHGPSWCDPKSILFYPRSFWKMLWNSWDTLRTQLNTNRTQWDTNRAQCSKQIRGKILLTKCVKGLAYNR